MYQSFIDNYDRECETSIQGGETKGFQQKYSNFD